MTEGGEREERGTDGKDDSMDIDVTLRPEVSPCACGYCSPAGAGGAAMTLC